MSGFQVEKLVQLTDNTYSYDDVISMECVVLRVLGFDLHLTVATDFLDRFLACLPLMEDVKA